jgi:16S rRNA (cytidine1402-2'-O)-methyltransferase
MPGTLFVVATPIGNLEDITVRALRVLREVSLIAAEDTRRTAHLLARHAIATPMTSLHEHNEVRKTPSLIARLQSGDAIALVSDAGTPTVSDPGGRLIRAAIDVGIRVEPIPGPSAVLAALAVSGLPTDSFLFLGFPPTRSKDRKQWFVRLQRASGTVVFFESPHRIRKTLTDLQALVGNCDVAIGRELTKMHEQLVRGPITSVLMSLRDDRGEFTVVADIGQSPDTRRPEPSWRPPDEVLVGEITETTGSSRRTAISRIAKKYQMPTNEVYAAIERAKKSGL